MPQPAVALVPARYASERLAAKPLQDLCGAPLIVRVCENLATTKVFERVVVAADHADIASAVQGAGFETVLTDPHLRSGTDRVAAAARQLGLPPDQFVVNVQGDEPFVSAATLSAVIAMLSSNPQAVATPVERIVNEALLADPNAVKVALGNRSRALYFSRSNIPFVRDTATNEAHAYHFRHVGVYGYSAATLQRLTAYSAHPLEELEKLEQLRWLAEGEQIFCPIVEPSYRGVDTLEDLHQARAHYATKFPHATP